MSTPLSWRAEAARQLGRRRTKWVFGILLALPIIFVGAFALDSGSSNSRSDNGPAGAAGARFVDLATSGSANFTVFALLVSGELLLYVLAALFAGDPVPAEASWASLRYLLTAPVTRARLLASKLVVGYASVAVALVILPAWALAVGSVFYGTEAFTIPGGGTLGWATLSWRLAVAIGYLFVSVLPIGAISFWVGVGTDTPLAAVGGALVVLIVSGILDTIDALGTWRNALPGHYARAWLDLLTGSEVDWTDIRHGTLWAVLYAIVFLALGFRRFRRKDILS
ncbi:MAG: ABC transporter permease subunit [Nostocoides sp.]